MVRVFGPPCIWLLRKTMYSFSGRRCCHELVAHTSGHHVQLLLNDVWWRMRSSTRESRCSTSRRSAVWRTSQWTYGPSPRGPWDVWWRRVSLRCRDWTPPYLHSTHTTIALLTMQLTRPLQPSGIKHALTQDSNRNVKIKRATRSALPPSHLWELTVNSWNRRAEKSSSFLYGHSTIPLITANDTSKSYLIVTICSSCLRYEVLRT